MRSFSTESTIKSLNQMQEDLQKRKIHPFDSINKAGRNMLSRFTKVEKNSSKKLLTQLSDSLSKLTINANEARRIDDGQINVMNSGRYKQEFQKELENIEAAILELLEDLEKNKNFYIDYNLDYGIVGGAAHESTSYEKVENLVRDYDLKTKLENLHQKLDGVLIASGVRDIKASTCMKNRIQTKALMKAKTTDDLAVTSKAGAALDSSFSDDRDAALIEEAHFANQVKRQQTRPKSAGDRPDIRRPH